LGNNDALSFMPATVVANVMAGGAKLDTAGINVTITAALLHDAGLPPRHQPLALSRIPITMESPTVSKTS
jgi:hypothetical protein